MEFIKVLLSISTLICGIGYPSKEMDDALSEHNLFASSLTVWVSKGHLYNEEETSVIPALFGTAHTEIALYWSIF